MKIVCVETETAYTSPIVGDLPAQVEDCINWLVRHLTARKPNVLKDIGLKSQMAAAAGVLNLGEVEGIGPDAELWDKTLNEHREAVAEMIGYAEIAEDLEQDAYNEGFSDCREQLATMLREKGLEELAEEIEKIEIEMAGDAEQLAEVAEQIQLEENLESPKVNGIGLVK